MPQNTSYYYTVRAINGSGAGPASNEATGATEQLIPTATITPLVPNTVLVGPDQLQIVFNEAVTGFTLDSLDFSRSGGPNLLTGSQTLTTSDNVTYTLGNLSSLDVLGGTYTLTFTAAGSTVIDSFGTAPIADATGSFVVSPDAPEVSAIYVNGSAWQQSFLNYLASSGLGDAQLGYRLMGGPDQLGSLPWTNINIISVAFSQDVNIDTADLALVGSADLAPPPDLSTATFAYDSATHVATWTYRTTLPLNKYLLSIPSASVTGTADGAALDGEFDNGSGALLPSGDTVAGGDFEFRFNILPGDIDRNGVVTGLDGSSVRQHFLQYPTTPGYDPLLDTYGKGAITGLDLLTVQGALLTSLPLTDPQPPVEGGDAAGFAALAEADLSPDAALAPAVASTSAIATPAATTPDAAQNSIALLVSPAAPVAAAYTAGAADTSETGTAVMGTSATIVAASIPDGLNADYLAGGPTAPTTDVVDRVFAALGEASADQPAHGAVGALLATRFSSFTDLNSLALSAPHHGSRLSAHDALFARLDLAGLGLASTGGADGTGRGDD